MICVVDTWEGVTAAGGKFLRTGYDFVHKNYPDVSLEWLTSMTGKTGMHYGVWHFPSLAAHEAFSKKINADEAWKKALKEIGPGPFWTSHRMEFYGVKE
jgi:hypothetical protein